MKKRWRVRRKNEFSSSVPGRKGVISILLMTLKILNHWQFPPEPSFLREVSPSFTLHPVGEMWAEQSTVTIGEIKPQMSLPVIRRLHCHYLKMLRAPGTEGRSVNRGAVSKFQLPFVISKLWGGLKKRFPTIFIYKKIFYFLIGRTAHIQEMYVPSSLQ